MPSISVCLHFVSCVPTAMLCFLCRFTDARLADMHALNELDTKAYSFFRWGAVFVLGGKADSVPSSLDEGGDESTA
jgi:hypothetical protein